jgi:antitoxin MazE
VLCKGLPSQLPLYVLYKLTEYYTRFKLCLNIWVYGLKIVMTEAILDIKRWGNSLGVRLPVAVARAAHLHEDQSVRISVEDGLVVLRPIKQVELSLEQRLAQFDPERHGGELMQTQRIGAERW